MVTIRYYERIGVLPAAARAANNYRQYGAAHLRRLRFVRRTRESGIQPGRGAQDPAGPARCGATTPATTCAMRGAGRISTTSARACRTCSAWKPRSRTSSGAVGAAPPRIARCWNRCSSKRTQRARRRTNSAGYRHPGSAPRRQPVHGALGMTRRQRVPEMGAAIPANTRLAADPAAPR
ncbi:MAG: MerR family transcriptional regulator [Halofilum sp. (in: g-proteobacteria)]|nr:MerR family transcriptional regulator [Halofilum sp. (in: g-proteobacteria)]